MNTDVKKACFDFFLGELVLSGILIMGVFLLEYRSSRTCVLHRKCRFLWNISKMGVFDTSCFPFLRRKGLSPNPEPYPRSFSVLMSVNLTLIPWRTHNTFLILINDIWTKTVIRVPLKLAVEGYPPRTKLFLRLPVNRDGILFFLLVSENRCGTGDIPEHSFHPHL